MSSTYRIETDNGSYDVEVDDSQQAQTQPEQGLVSKTWDALKVPEQMSRQGLQSLASMVPQPEPTGNLPLDLLKGTPRIAANTLAEAAPGFISRGSILTAGAAKALQAARPIGSVVGQGIAKQAENITGAVPGSLKSAWNDFTLMFARGKNAAGPLYEAAKAELPEGASIFKGMYKPEQIVDAAQEYLDKGGKLEPAEALTYRKALDVLGRSNRYIKDELYAMRQGADAAAKASPNIAEADPLYQRGRMAESLRNLVPQNKWGGASAFKLGIMTALENMGVPGKLGLAIMSPAAAGVASTVGGLTSRVLTNPAAAMTARQALITAYISKRQEQSQ